MSKIPATPAQVAFLADIAKELGVTAPVPADKAHAKELIESGIAARSAKRAAEKKAKKAVEQAALEGVEPLKAGRHEITGEVVFAAYRDSNYGPTPKMIVLDDLGRKVWLTVPAKIADQFEKIEDLKGSTVTGVVTVTVKDEDPHFGFGSRPADFKVAA